MATAITAYTDAYNKGPVTNETAKKVLDESLAIDEAEAQLKKATATKVMTALPAMKKARHMQTQNKIRAAIRYKLAANIPLVPSRVTKCFLTERIGDQCSSDFLSRCS